MAKDREDVRARAEERFNRAQRTTEDAKKQTDTELGAARKKTAYLKALRLAKEAAEE